MLHRMAVTALISLIASGSAVAEEYWYAGIGATFSFPDVDAVEASASVGSRWSGAPTTVDNKGNGLKLYAGRQLSDFLGLELGYTDFGRTGTYSTLLGPTSRDTAAVQWRGFGIELSALGYWRVGEIVSLYGRGGITAWRLERKIVEDGTAGHFTRSGTDTGISPLAGAGVAFRFTEQGTLRLEYQRSFKVGSDAVGYEADVDVVSVTAHYHF